MMDGWLAELGLEPVDRGEREGITSWDLILDGRRRADIRLTLILDPASILLCWVHFAPPLNDSFRVSYRQFLRWNDEWPYVKFALSAEERPVLTSELSADALDLDAVGVAICRLLAVCDLLLDGSVRWLWPGAKKAPGMGRESRQESLFVRYEAELMELLPAAVADDSGKDAKRGAAEPVALGGTEPARGTSGEQVPGDGTHS
jgi:hypothetical protein